ncbi:hypothetical protein PF005_g33589 [Phytophthora fragariae]|uniref:RxLR effector protein n=1 Tax=Phytophthora fragariae TaxID=53985 RepID=A0A6A3D5C8_9STRA|nr:hypothetical protein PF009_g33369 [Phytophthora fragariae]KAE8951280.1 hypothetical protein PF011_g33013 [Phytophthora fragariae]KAE9055934.1 hypothetical protein PF010_g31957 [Phytophthora fragariae]KAE9148056.1 hypothetical protein PF005_g33589 [Phytophthora fragariae]KAE9148763.1 hypothetical protein PF004_g32954 [Phytophthora fragariae]
MQRYVAISLLLVTTAGLEPPSSRRFGGRSCRDFGGTRASGGGVHRLLRSSRAKVPG